MTTTFTIKNKDLTLTENTKELITTTIERKIGSFIQDISITIEKCGRKFSVILKTRAYGIEIYATGEHLSLMPALNDALDIAKRKIRKARTKVIDKKRTDTVDAEDVEDKIEIIDVTEIVPRPLDDETALFEAVMADRNTYVFRENDGGISILVKKNEGYQKLVIRSDL